MAFTSRSGQKFTNLSQAKAADRRFGNVAVLGRSIGDGKQPVADIPYQAAPTKPSKTNSSSGSRSKPFGDTPSIPDNSTSDAVSQHGPASRVIVTHEDGRHAVVATMGDGSEHRSDHSTPDEAHDAARTLSGIDKTPEINPMEMM